MKVRLSKRADREMRSIDAWWRENRPEAPSRFADELRKALQLLVTAPHSGNAYGTYRGRLVRRVLLPISRDHVYYVVDDRGLHVLSIWGGPKERPPTFRS